LSGYLDVCNLCIGTQENVANTNTSTLYTELSAVACDVHRFFSSPFIDIMNFLLIIISLCNWSCLLCKTMKDLIENKEKIFLESKFLGIYLFQLTCLTCEILEIIENFINCLNNKINYKNETNMMTITVFKVSDISYFN
jgi:hypothetical protein